MVQKLLLIISITLISCALYSQENYNVNLVSNVEYDDLASDIWGYVDDVGREYAVMGLNNSTVVLSLEDPANPVELIRIPGARSTWRDIKSYGDFLYVTADVGNEGLLIIDMSEAPLKITWELWNEDIVITGNPRPLNTCHNLYIDENGIMYLAGCNANANGAVLMFDLNENPRDPEFLGPTDFEYSHDVYARGDTVYSSQINAGQLAIFDVSDKFNPVLLGAIETSLSFTHNLWLSDDGKYLFSTDEKPNGTIDAYDISELPEIRRIDSFSPLDVEDTGSIPHNVHYYNGYLVISWYTSGCVIVDAHNPSNLIQVGAYDTWDGPDGGFNGAWGAYPFLPSGRILISDIQSGLFVLEPEYVRASYLEGRVTDANTGLGINNVRIEIDSDILSLTRSNFVGEYKTGLRVDGTFDVTFSHPNYLPATVSIDLLSGEITFLDIELLPEGVPTQVDLNFVDENNDPLSEVQVLFTNEKYIFEDTTDINGNISTLIFEGEFDIYAGKWGYNNIFLDDVSFPEGVDTSIVLGTGYEDDFEVDLGWTEKFTAAVGKFERAIPEATDLNGEISNPGSSSPLSTGPYCYVTGPRAGNQVGDFDVDDGYTEIKSPIMILDDYENPYVQFDYWFYNSGGFGNPNDEFKVVLYNGEDYRELFFTQESQSVWRTFEAVPLRDYIDYVGKPIEIIFYTIDQDPGHIVEAAFDRFIMSDRPIVSTEDLSIRDQYSLYPNPTNGIFTFQSDGEQIVGDLQIVHLNGSVVYNESMNNSNNRKEINLTGMSPGMYLVYVLSPENGRTFVSKLMLTY